MTQYKKYWFFLEPYAFVFEGDIQTVVYNHLNAAYIPVPDSEAVGQIVVRLLEADSGYCTEISETELHDPQFSGFLKQIRDTFSGDIVDQQEAPHKPFIFRPLLQLKDNFHHFKNKEKKEDTDVFRRNILKYLGEVNLYLTTACAENCADCGRYQTQLLWCTKQDTPVEMPWERLIPLLDRMEGCGVGRVNFLGGDLRGYSSLRQLVALLGGYSFKKRFYLPLLSLNEEIDAFLPDESFGVTVLADLRQLSGLTAEEERYLFADKQAEFCFPVCSVAGYETAQQLTERYGLQSVVKPYYTGENLDFFETHIYPDLQDLLEAGVDKKDIFRRQTVNENFFGKLTVLPDGEVHANLNHLSLGNLFDGQTLLNEIVYREFEEGKDWFSLRNQGTCKQCCNRYLCASPSQYEAVIGRPDLCHIR